MSKKSGYFKKLFTKLFDRYPKVEYIKFDVDPINSKQLFVFDEIGLRLESDLVAASMVRSGGGKAMVLVPEGGGEQLIREVRLPKGAFYICVEYYSPGVGEGNTIKMYSTHDGQLNVYQLDRLVRMISPKLKAKEYPLEAWFKRGVIIKVPVQWRYKFLNYFPGWIFSIIKRVP